MAAYQNIITDCFSGTSVTPSDNPNASWVLGQEWYWITFNNSVPTIGENVADEDVLVNSDGSEGLE
jgi:hypothetical protein